MSSHPESPIEVVANPADSVLLSLARAVAGASVGAGATWPRLDLADPKQREFGDYELLEEIGRGGMGVVYRARQRSLDREVAIKFIADWFADMDGVARFLAEARAAARLLHPNIVPVHEVGSIDGLHYFSMPLIRGRSLSNVLDAGPMPQAEAIALLLKICDAIDYAHRLGLLHLDLKPANVLIDERGEPLVADFGLARHVDERGGVDAQEVSGTPQYMAPEQILIRQYRLTRATDIYALGAIAYRCLTGVSPHGEGKPDDVIRRAVAGRIRAPREVNAKLPRDLDAICMKCMELQPSDRYASVAQLADDLRRARDGLPVSVRRAGIFERAQRWVLREPRLAIAIGLALFALLAGAAATTWQWREAAAERDRASIASGIGAQLFANQGDESVDDESRRADALIAWLRKRLPGDEQRQADALSAFVGSIDALDADKTESLIGKVVAVLGVDYRRQMIRSLQTSKDPSQHLHSALLAWADEAESADPKQFRDSMQAAIVEQPGSRLVWQVAAAYCPGPWNAEHCLFPEAAEKLVRLDPENAYAWLVLASKTPDPQRAREALHEAAQRTRFDDYLATTFTAYRDAVDAAGLPAPPLIARPLQVIAASERPELGIASALARDAPLYGWGHLMTLCGAKPLVPVTDAQVLADCHVIGGRMMRSNASVISRMVGVALFSAHASDSAELEDARQYRRLYTYLTEVNGHVAPGTHALYTQTMWWHDITTIGEMAALQHEARSLGFPDHPPSNWTKDDPMALRSTPERYARTLALNRDARSLVAQGKFGEAIALMADNEQSMRSHYAHNWMLARFLTTLGRARLGQHDYVGASAALGDGWSIAADLGPDSADARDCAQAMVELYTAWNAAEKNNGYDVRANDWKLTLATLDAGRDSLAR
jgi:hypothetical protein